MLSEAVNVDACRNYDLLFLSLRGSTGTAYSHKRPATVIDTIFTSQGCPLTRASTVFSIFYFYPEEDSEEEKLKDLVLFWTGYPSLPRDNACRLLVEYLPQQRSKVLPEADACSATLKIPTIHEKYEDFKKFMDCSIAHGKVGFGRM